MHSVFRYGPDGRLAVGGVGLHEAVRAAGGTPAYVYDASAVQARYERLDRAFESRLPDAPRLICAALKANALPALLEPLLRSGAGAEAVSAAELLVADAVGFPPERIVLSGVGKNATDLDVAFELGIGFLSVESDAELDVLAKRVGAGGRLPRVLLRLNPEIRVGTHEKIATGSRGAKFGMDRRTLLAAARRASNVAGIEIAGVHAHVGSQIRDVRTLAESAGRLRETFLDLERAGLPVEVMDVGGGLAIPQRDDEEAEGREPAPGFDEYAEAVAGALEGMSAMLLLEPGRSLFGPAGALVMRVLHAKSSAGRRFLVVDAGLNDFIRPAMYGAHHRILPLEPRPGAVEKFDVVGGVCESSDRFGTDRETPPPEPGDLLAILDAGAYGYSLASNANLRPRPAEVVVRNGAAELARPAETPAELAARVLGAGDRTPSRRPSGALSWAGARR